MTVTFMDCHLRCTPRVSWTPRSILIPGICSYPKASGNGTGAWADAYVKAKAFVAQLTEDEKINMTAGASSSVVDNSCSGNIQPITRLGFPGMCITDAGQGVVSET